MLLTTRACGRGLELDGKKGIKVWSVRFLNKEKGLTIGGVKFDVPPRYTVRPTVKVEMAGGGQEEEEGDVKMNEKRRLKNSTKTMGITRLNLPRQGVGSGRKGRGRGGGNPGRPKKVKVVPSPAAVKPMSSHFSLYRGGRWVGRRGGWRWRPSRTGRKEEAMGVGCGGAARIERFNED